MFKNLENTGKCMSSAAAMLMLRYERIRPDLGLGQKKTLDIEDSTLMGFN